MIKLSWPTFRVSWSWPKECTWHCDWAHHSWGLLSYSGISWGFRVLGVEVNRVRCLKRYNKMRKSERED